MKEKLSKREISLPFNKRHYVDDHRRLKQVQNYKVLKKINPKFFKIRMPENANVNKIFATEIISLSYLSRGYLNFEFNNTVVFINFTMYNNFFLSFY